MILAMVIFSLFFFRIHSTSKKDRGFIWQISDFHIFGPNSVVDFQKDVNLIVLDSILEFIRKEDDEVVHSDGILFLGDIPYHYPWLNKKGTLELIDSGISLLLKHLGGKKLISTSGNHDALPMDMLDLTDRFIFDRFLNLQNHFTTDPHSLNMLKEKGYYSDYLTEKLKVIALQQNWMNLRDVWRPKSAADEELDWVKIELENSRMNNERVIIVGHIPPTEHWNGLDMNFHERFVHLVREFEDIVFFCSFGHLHVPRFSLIYGQKKKIEPTLLFIGPSLWGIRPRVALLEYDKKKMEMIDIHILDFDIETDTTQEQVTNFDVSKKTLRELFHVPKSKKLTTEKLEDIVDDILEELDDIGDLKRKSSQSTTTRLQNTEIINFMEFVDLEEDREEYEYFECQILRGCYMKFTMIENIIKCVDSYEYVFQKMDLEGEDFWSFVEDEGEKLGSHLYSLIFQIFVDLSKKVSKEEANVEFEKFLAGEKNVLEGVDRESVVELYQRYRKEVNSDGGGYYRLCKRSEFFFLKKWKDEKGM